MKEGFKVQGIEMRRWGKGGLVGKEVVEAKVGLEVWWDL